MMLHWRLDPPYFFFFGFLTGLGDPISKSPDPPLLPVFALLCFGFLLVLLFLFGIAVSSANSVRIIHTVNNAFSRTWIMHQVRNPRQ
jgi:hypothetical protein